MNLLVFVVSSARLNRQTLLSLSVLYINHPLYWHYFSKFKFVFSVTSHQLSFIQIKLVNVKINQEIWSSEESDLICSLNLLGGAHGSHDVKSFTLQVPVTLNEGTTNISILSVMDGLPVMYQCISSIDYVLYYSNGWQWYLIFFEQITLILQLSKRKNWKEVSNNCMTLC